KNDWRGDGFVSWSQQHTFTHGQPNQQSQASFTRQHATDAGERAAGRRVVNLRSLYQLPSHSILVFALESIVLLTCQSFLRSTATIRRLLCIVASPRQAAPFE